MITWATTTLTVPLIVLLAVTIGGGIGWIAAGLVVVACVTVAAALWLAHRRTERELIKAAARIIREGRPYTLHGQDAQDQQ
ncbi:hypothetical protein [Pseudonocardia hydrocarbonoxydans]|uniref:hypothetical protein n=1 Tax=Pseudonocardia hydrocarbonoxydans TaxID=76726 RepID=UPI0031D6A700